MHPVGQQRIVDGAHTRPGALLHPLDGRLRGQAAVDRLVDPAGPALVIGEHLVGLEHLLVLSTGAELDLSGHLFDLFAHPPESAVDPLPLGFRVLRDELVDSDVRLVEHDLPARQPLDEHQARQDIRIVPPAFGAEGVLPIDQVGPGDQFGHDHGGGLKRLDLHLLVTARIDVLDA